MEDNNNIFIYMEYNYYNKYMHAIHISTAHGEKNENSKTEAFNLCNALSGSELLKIFLQTKMIKRMAVIQLKSFSVNIFVSMRQFRLIK